MKSKLNILIIDDDRVSQIYLSELIDLILKDANVIKADSGEKALELLKKYSFHFIFSDLLMPGLSEAKLFDELKEAVKFSSSTKIVAVSGLDSEEEIRRLAPGASRVIVKPVKRDELKSLLMGEGIDIKDEVREDNGEVVMDLNLIVKLYQNKSDKLISLLNLYKKTLPNQFNTLRDAFKAMDNQRIKNSAHSLKNSFAYLGAAPLRNKCLYVEDNALVQNNPEKVKACLDEILASEPTVLKKIEDLILSYD